MQNHSRAQNFPFAVRKIKLLLPDGSSVCPKISFNHLTVCIEEDFLTMKASVEQIYFALSLPLVINNSHTTGEWDTR